MRKTRRPPRLTRLRTVRQMDEEPSIPFGESSLRWLIFNSEMNGFEQCIVRLGRRLFIDLDAFEDYLGQSRGSSVGPLQNVEPPSVAGRGAMRDDRAAGGG